jgi:hypothetical protein
MNGDVTKVSFTLRAMITQMRFNYGSETRKQPNIEKADFQTLLEYERQEVKLTDKLHARLGPAVAAKVRHWSERYIGHPAPAITLHSLQLVSYFKCHCT